MTDFVYLIPEIVLFLTLLGLLANEISYHGEKYRLVRPTALVGFAAALIQIVISFRFVPTTKFGDSISIDGLTVLFKFFLVSIGFFATALSGYSRELTPRKQSEYACFVVGAVLSMCLAVSATDFLLLFLALQAAGVSIYLLAGHSKREPRSTEASVKFLVFGALAAALFLYGTVILFAHTHTLNMIEMRAALGKTPLPHAAGSVAVLLLLISISFYAGVYPMYLWVPDVLEGAPAASALFISVAVPVTGFAVALRILGSAFGFPASGAQAFHPLGEVNWTQVLALFSGASMVLGSLLSLRQWTTRRLIGCLIVAQSGFFLTGLLVVDPAGVAALVYNLVINVLALIGLFSALMVVSDRAQSDHLEEIRQAMSRIGGGLILECICLVLFFACFMGFPPMPGFLGRFSLLEAAVHSQRYGIAILSMLAMVLSVASFARFSFYIMGGFQMTGRTGPAIGAPRGLLMSLVGFLVLLTVFADRILAWATYSLKTILW